ncbi:MAG: hypothetical protein COA94_06195 [Rickettsiales bacterium]|nr:MAG: hypothetical protein COA94_06195 [Rickettsiales bacterium]
MSIHKFSLLHHAFASYLEGDDCDRTWIYTVERNHVGILRELLGIVNAQDIDIKLEILQNPDLLRLATSSKTRNTDLFSQFLYNACGQSCEEEFLQSAFEFAIAKKDVARVTYIVEVAVYFEVITPALVALNSLYTVGDRVYQHALYKGAYKLGLEQVYAKTLPTVVKIASLVDIPIDIARMIVLGFLGYPEGDQNFLDITEERISALDGNASEEWKALLDITEEDISELGSNASCCVIC